MFDRIMQGTPAALKGITPKQFFETPEVKAITDRLASAALVARKKLATRFGELCTEEADKQCAPFVAAVSAAEHKEREAKAAFELAVQARIEAGHAWAARSNQIAIERGQLEGELRATADPRLMEFLAELSGLFDRSRNQPITYDGHAEVREPSAAEIRAAQEKAVGGMTAHEIARARADGWSPHAALKRIVKLVIPAERVDNVFLAIASVRGEVLAVQLLALDTEEVTQRLRAWCDRLRVPLAGVGLSPPLIREEEVAPPLERG